MNWAILVLIAGVVAFGLLLLRSTKSIGAAEAKLDLQEAEKQTIIENRKAKYENIHVVNNLSEPERTRLRDKWSKK